MGKKWETEGGERREERVSARDDKAEEEVRYWNERAEGEDLRREGREEVGESVRRSEACSWCV